MSAGREPFAGRTGPVHAIALCTALACGLISCAPAQAPTPSTPTLPTAAPPHVWAEWERSAIVALGLDALAEAPDDPTNRFAAEPRAAELGHRLFFDPALSANGEISCATCHVPALGFTDGLARAKGIAEVERGTPSLIGISWSPWLFWDGRSDSTWSQALGPMQAPAEMGSARVDLARTLLARYGSELAAIAGSQPELDDPTRFPAGAGPEVADEGGRAAWAAMRATDRDAVNRVVVAAAKTIGAYERLLRPGPVALDRYVDLLRDGDGHGDPASPAMRETFSDEEVQGLRLFVGKAECTHCHNGPRLTNDDFHNIGLSPLPDHPADLGRADGVHALLDDAFTCDKGYSDAGPDDCLELRFLKTEGPTLAGAFKTPTLRGVADTAPYMHDGRFGSFEQVLAHYDAAEPGEIGVSELIPLGLVEAERRQLAAFLGTLEARLATQERWLVAPTD